MISLGGSGVISVIANAFPGDFSQMVRFALNDQMDEARKIHYKLLPVISLMFEEGNPAGVKAFLSHKGIIKNNLRLPLLKASKALMSKVSLLDRTIQ